MYFIDKEKRVIVIADNIRDARKLFLGAWFDSAGGLRRISARNVVTEVGRSGGYEVVMSASRMELRLRRGGDDE